MILYQIIIFCITETLLCPDEYINVNETTPLNHYQKNIKEMIPFVIHELAYLNIILTPFKH